MRPVPKNERQWSIVWTTDGIEKDELGGNLGETLGGQFELVDPDQATV